MAGADETAEANAASAAFSATLISMFLVPLVIRLLFKRGRGARGTWIAVALLGGCMWAVLSGLEISQVEVFDPFAILSVDEGSSTAKIKRAYRKLARELHPDKPTGDAARFRVVAKAYEALTDPASMENWRRYGHPDGPQATRLGMALVDGGALWVLLIGGLLFIGLLVSAVLSSARRRTARREILRHVAPHLSDATSTPSEVAAVVASSPPVLEFARRAQAAELAALAKVRIEELAVGSMVDSWDVEPRVARELVALPLLWSAADDAAEPTRLSKRASRALRELRGLLTDALSELLEAAVAERWVGAALALNGLLARLNAGRWAAVPLAPGVGLKVQAKAEVRGEKDIRVGDKITVALRIFDEGAGPAAPGDLGPGVHLPSSFFVLLVDKRKRRIVRAARFELEAVPPDAGATARRAGGAQVQFTAPPKPGTLELELLIVDTGAPGVALRLDLPVPILEALEPELGQEEGHAENDTTAAEGEAPGVVEQREMYMID